MHLLGLLKILMQYNTRIFMFLDSPHLVFYPGSRPSTFKIALKSDGVIIVL